MREGREIGTPMTSGLRTRYFPRARIGQGLVSVGPWLDVILLIIFFLLVDSRFVLQPGVIVDLPTAPFRNGSRLGMVAVVMSVKGAEAGSRREIVFFDDERFLVEDEAQMDGLKRAFDGRIRKYPDASLVLEADRRVPHGTVVNIMDMALDVGVRQVNLAVRPF